MASRMIVQIVKTSMLESSEVTTGLAPLGRKAAGLDFKNEPDLTSSYPMVEWVRATGIESKASSDWGSAACSATDQACRNSRSLPQSLRMTQKSKVAMSQNTG